MNTVLGSTMGQIPSHVPRESIFEYDIYADPRLKDDVQLGMMTLLREAPDIFWTPLNGGHWMVTRYDHVREIVMAADKFSNENASVRTMENSLAIKLPPQDMDAPDHMKHRMLLLKFLSPKHLRRQEDAVKGLMNKLIDNLEGRNACDFKDEIGVTLPVVTFLSMMQWDLSRARQFVGWVNDIIGTSDPDIRGPAYFDLLRYIDEMIDQRAGKQGADPLSVLLQSEIDEKPITHERVREMATLLFTAGLDTVTNAMTFIMKYLAEHPEMQGELRAEPDKIDAAVEELLRRHSFVNTFRRVKQDIRFHGVQFKKDDILTCSLCTASNDERKFPCPERVDISRSSTTHLAFNTGPHNCVGAPLARIELRVFLREWLRRMPNVRLSPDWKPETRGGPVMTLETLDIVW
jgi:cytochrome P450